MKCIFLSLVVLISMSMAQAQDENLVVIGGGSHHPKDAMKRVADLSKQRDGKILIIGWASKQFPKEDIKVFVDDLSPYFQDGEDFWMRSVKPPKTLSDLNDILKQIESASGIIFTGGVQYNIMDAVERKFGDSDKLKDKKNSIKAALKNAYASGVVFVGTSAGTDVMADTMIRDYPKNSGDPVPVRPGLGLLLSKDWAIDTHFSQRPDRAKRLKDAMIQNRLKIGIGIDEDTSLIFHGENKAQVVGDGYVQIYQLSDDGRSAHMIEKMRAGDQWDFSRFELIRESRFFLAKGKRSLTR